METIIKKMCVELDNDKLFNSIMHYYVGGTFGKIFSDEELEQINAKYQISLKDIIFDSKKEFFKAFFTYIDLSKVTTIKDWLYDWADYDDISLFTLQESTEGYDDWRAEGYKIDDLIYEKECDNYMQYIIPDVLNFYLKNK